VRDLNRRAEDQQQSTAKSEGEPPRVAHVIFGLLIVHHCNYNAPRTLEAGTLPACGQKRTGLRKILTVRRLILRMGSLRSCECLGNSLFPSSLGLQDKFHYFPC
jgi:hypothetical protein